MRRALAGARRKTPSGPISLSAFQSPGLWLDVMATPPPAPVSITSSWIVGVGATPMSTGSQPTEQRPATTAASTAGPLLLVSLPTITGPGPDSSPNAAAKPSASAVVNDLPKTPLIPEPLMMGASKYALSDDLMEPAIGLEPMTCALRVRCSTT